MYDRAPRILTHAAACTSAEVGPGKYNPNTLNKKKQGYYFSVSLN